MAWPRTSRLLASWARPRAEHAVALLVLALAVFSQWPTLVSHFVVNNDTRMHTFWMAQWRHPELFQHDLIALYARAFQPWGYLALYRLAAWVVSPLFISRVLPFLLLPALGVFLFRLGRDSAGEAATPGLRTLTGALAAAFGCLAPVVLQKMAGGHARAFALPFLALACWLVLRRAWRWLGGALFLASLFYPVSAILGGLVAVLSAWEWRQGRPRFTGGRELLVSLAVAAALAGGVVLARAAWLPPEVGSVATRADIEGRPEFGREGVYPVFPTPSPWVVAAQEIRRSTAVLPPRFTATPPRGESVGGKANRLDWALFLVVAVLLAMARPLRLPAALPALFGAGLLAFLAADLLLMQLYMPVRYLQYAIRLGVPWLGALVIARFLAWLPSRSGRAAVAVLGLALPLGNLGSLRGIGLEDYAKRKKLYVYLARTPVDSLVAAHPLVADGVPLFSRRSVLVDFEHAQPFYPRYWSAMRQRTRDFFAAYYAAELNTVCSFMREHGVTHLVVEQRHFRFNYLRDRRLYFEPFQSEIRAATAGRTQFALRRLPRGRTVWSLKDAAVVTPASLGCSPPPWPPPGSPATAPSGN